MKPIVIFLDDRVDLHIPSEDVVGGYSITSPPHQLTEQGTINLAIQHSDHPPTYWMTTKVYTSISDILNNVFSVHNYEN